MAADFNDVFTGVTIRAAEPGHQNVIHFSGAIPNATEHYPAWNKPRRRNLADEYPGQDRQCVGARQPYDGDCAFPDRRRNRGYSFGGGHGVSARAQRRRFTKEVQSTQRKRQRKFAWLIELFVAWDRQKLDELIAGREVAKERCCLVVSSLFKVLFADCCLDLG